MFSGGGGYVTLTSQLPKTLISRAGLSASIWTALYVGLFQPHAIDFLLFLAFVPAALTLVGLCFVNAVPFEQASEALAPRRFMFAIQVGCSEPVLTPALSLFTRPAHMSHTG